MNELQLRTFTEAAQRRIAAAVRDVEQMRRDIRGQRRGGGFTYPNPSRPAIAYGNIPAGDGDSAGVGEMKLFRINYADGTFGTPEAEPTRVFNLGQEIPDGNRLIATLDIQGKLADGQKAIWICGYDSAASGQYGYAQIAPSDPDLSTHAIGAVEGLRLVQSNGYVQHDSNPGSPLTTIAGGAGTEDAIRVERTGIWTGHFSVSIRIPTTISATPPGDYTHKILKVTGPAGSVNLSNGAISGASVVTHDGCLHELFIRRTFTVYKNALLIAPRTNNDGYIASAAVWNKMDCGNITYYDAHISFTEYLEENDLLQIFWDTDEDVGADPGAIVFSSKLVLHYNNEPLA